MLILLSMQNFLEFLETLQRQERLGFCMEEVWQVLRRLTAWWPMVMYFLPALEAAPR
jgi:hypothetical protein